MLYMGQFHLNNICLKKILLGRGPKPPTVSYNYLATIGTRRLGGIYAERY